MPPPVGPLTGSVISFVGGRFGAPPRSTVRTNSSGVVSMSRGFVGRPIGRVFEAPVFSLSLSHSVSSVPLQVTFPAIIHIAKRQPIC